MGMTVDTVDFGPPDGDLGQRLPPVARRIFTETFGALYDRGPFETFCDAAYSPGGAMDRDLRSPDVHWRVAAVDGEPIGYAKLTPLRAPAPEAITGSMELQQLYVLSRWQGKGVADELMAWAVATASGLNAPELYLTVFDHNERAKRFYARNGFEEVGRCTFQLGDRVDDDRVWRRRLSA
jgi:GNAT superfamily N-acetyltransferase